MLRFITVSFTLICIVVFTGTVAKAQSGFAGPMVTRNYPGPEKLQYNQEAYTWYRAWRDSSNIYVQLEIANTVQQNKIFQNGMEVWIDVKNKKNKKTGIEFPLVQKTKQPPASFGQWMEKNESAPDRTSGNALLQKQIDGAREIQVTGFINELNGKQNSHHPSGITLEFSTRGDTLLYYAIVPVKVLAVQPDEKATIAIGIVQKGVPFTGGGDGPPPMGEGMPPGPPPGGMNEGDRSMFQMMEDNIFWFKIRTVK